MNENKRCELSHWIIYELIIQSGRLKSYGDRFYFDLA